VRLTIQQSEGECRGDAPQAGFTVSDLAARWRVSPDKVRAWINRGELRAVNTSATLCGRPRWVVSADAVAAFERRRSGGPTPKPQRRRKATDFIDFFPDAPGEEGGAA
jgi:hypothetical protein